MSAPDLDLGRYDIVNAVGVMFHIVDDGAWLQAIRNLSGSLAPGGLIAIGGQFGWLTRDVQFHRNDAFPNWQELHNAPEDRGVLMNKRIRSLCRWRWAARQTGLKVVRVIRTPVVWSLPAPENNILLLKAI